MKRCWFGCLLLCSIVAVVPGFAQASAGVSSKPLTALEQTLIASDKALGDAQKQKNVDVFKRTLTDDFVGVGTDGSQYDKNDVLEAVRMADVKEYRPYDIEILPIDENVAVVTYNCIVRMTLYDEPIPRYQRISSIWVKQGEQWRLKFQQATPTP
jgi:hypothetical protein